MVLPFPPSHPLLPLLFLLLRFLSFVLLIDSKDLQILHHALNNQPPCTSTAHPGVSRSSTRYQILDARCYLILVVRVVGIWLSTLDLEGTASMRSSHGRYGVAAVKGGVKVIV